MSNLREVEIAFRERQRPGNDDRLKESLAQHGTIQPRVTEPFYCLLVLDVQPGASRFHSRQRAARSRSKSGVT